MHRNSESRAQCSESGENYVYICLLMLCSHAYFVCYISLCLQVNVTIWHSLVINECQIVILKTVFLSISTPCTQETYNSSLP